MRKGYNTGMLFELGQVALFYLHIFFIGLFGTVIVRKLFGYSVRTSYVFGRVVGMLVLAYVVWLFSVLNVLPFTSWYIWIVYGALFITILYFSRSGFTKIDLIQILKVELLYLVSFVFMIGYLFVSPDITGGEKYMNFGIFNSLLNFDVLPPKDMWLAPYSLNYYYFGHVIYTIPVKMLSLQPEIAYNLLLSCIFGLVFLQTYYFGFKITSKVTYALLGSFLVCFAGNLFPVLYFLLNPNADVSVIQHSVRFIPDAINDFPSYSFFLGGLHAHVFGLPLVLLFLYLLYRFYCEDFRPKIYLPAFAFLLGCMYVINSWDFLIYGAILGLVLAALLNVRKFLVVYPVVILSAFLFFIVFHLTTGATAIYGIGYVGTPSGPIRIIAMFGIFMLLLGPWLLQRLLIVLRGGFDTITKSDSYVLVIILVGLLVIFGTEIIYIKDLLSLENFARRRTNTVYKLWYQVWILFSIATPYVLYKVLSWKNNFYKPTLIIVSFVLSLSLIYPIYTFVATYYNKIYSVADFEATLDGTAYLKQTNPDIYDGLSYLKTLDKDIVILEPPGEQYGVNHSIFSTYTGIPSVLGWYNHERVWRGAPPEIYDRLYDIKTIYSATAPDKVAELLQKYKVDYVIVNDHARELYGDSAGDGVREFSTTVYKNDTIEFLKISNLPDRSQQ